MKTLILKIQSLAKGRNVFGLFILLFIVYVSVNLTFAALLGRLIGPNSLILLDSKIGYKTADAFQLFNALTLPGRRLILGEYAFDFIIPLIYGLFLATLIAFLFSKVFAKNGKIFALSLLPLVMGFCDWIENIGMVTMIIKFPKLSEGLVSFTSLFTTLKLSAGAVSLMIVIFGVLSIIFKLFKARFAAVFNN